MNILMKAMDAREERVTLGYELTEMQKRVVESDRELTTACFDRQEGCSTTALLKAHKYARDNKKSSVYILCQSVTHAKSMNIMLMRMLSKVKVGNKCFASNACQKIVLKNGSTIYFKSIKEVMRGCRPDMLITDGISIKKNLDTINSIACTCKNVVLLFQD